MARTSSLAYEQVAAICAQIAAGGQRPTIARVAVALGNKGSTRVISSYLTRYFEESGSALQIERNTRPRWSDAENLQADLFLNQLRDLAFTHARAAFDGERLALREQHEDMLERVQAAEDAAAELVENKEKLEAVIQQQTEQLATLRDAYIGLQDELENTRAELAGCQTRLEHAMGELVSQKDAMATLERELNARREVEVEQLRSQLTGELHAAGAAHAAELSREREIAQGERAYLMEQTHELRQALTREKETLEKALVEARKDADAARTLAAQYRTDLAVERGRLEERAGQLAKAEQGMEVLAARVQALELQLPVERSGDMS
ncbi:DNA-binding protein [Crenobacter caeni]|uniref:KfrA N-terminal DNA-binding domain-containing protein n=1 Tax=Crenobacter caeni TaxID=2705474 RepID=A0A6B2KVU1_9NEIS|nr:DNA-binding protein [Crenobacter caeni]NDV14087.1 hypothetical protein [Crenobacter caeni]